MTQIVANEHPFTTDKDISSYVFWSRTFVQRDETFAWLRKNAPVSWHPPLEDEYVPPEIHKEPGFWAITRAEDIQYVSQNNKLFSTAAGSVMVRPRHPDTIQPPNFLEMDPPEHTGYRQIMSAAFTPKAIARIGDKIRERAGAIVGRVVGAGDIDLVEEVSAKLPMLTLADMLGVPENLTESFAQAADNFVGGNDESMLPPGVTPIEFMVEQLGILSDIGVNLVKLRRNMPADDIATAIAEAEIDGKPLTDEQISSLMLLLSVAGNDTTKQTTTWTVLSLHRNPEQKLWLREDFEGRISGAVEEFVRHASPVMEFARTMTQDFEFRGQKLLRGDKVGIFYCSGNRDESVFEDPHRFDIKRSPQPHVGFGGGGVHYCLGNGLAKAQLKALFRELSLQLPNLEVIGEPEYLKSEFINGIRHLQVRTN